MTSGEGSKIAKKPVTSFVNAPLYDFRKFEISNIVDFPTGHHANQACVQRCHISILNNLLKHGEFGKKLAKIMKTCNKLAACMKTWKCWKNLQNKWKLAMWKHCLSFIRDKTYNQSGPFGGNVSDYSATGKIKKNLQNNANLTTTNTDSQQGK